MATTGLKLLAALAFIFALHPSAQADVRASDYEKILIFGEGEDATSWFDTIFLFKNGNKLERVITIWNGGCCQAPLIEEFKRSGARLEHDRSYNVDEKPKDFPKYILCTSPVRETRIEPTHDAARGMTRQDLAPYLADAKPFQGC